MVKTYLRMMQHTNKSLHAKDVFHLHMDYIIRKDFIYNDDKKSYNKRMHKPKAKSHNFLVGCQSALYLVISIMQ